MASVRAKTFLEWGGANACNSGFIFAHTYQRMKLPAPDSDKIIFSNQLRGRKRDVEAVLDGDVKNC
jgi:hypothetical protein